MTRTLDRENWRRHRRPLTGAPTLTVRLVSLALFYLGLSVSLPLTDVIAWRWPLSLGVAGLLAVVGWRGITATPSLKRYLGWALGLCAWLAVSSVAAWARLPLYRGRILILWLGLVVPGLSSLLRDRGRRDVFVGGLAVGGSVYGLVAVYRLVQGLPVFDINAAYPDRFMLGQNRNIPAAVALMVLPLLLSGALPRPLRALRWPLAGLSFTWIVFSKSRLVLLGLVLVALVYVLMQPGGAGKMRRLYVALVAAIIILVGIQEVGGQARVSINRVSAGFSDDGSSNEIRRLLIRKAWHLAIENPVFGIGLGRFAGAYDPVIDEGSTESVRRQVGHSYDHNGYAGLMAEAGFPALVLLLLLLAGLMRGAISHRGSASVSTATCVYTVALLYLVAQSLVPLTFVSITLLLASVTAQESRVGGVA
jgi:hypothetical protein